MSTEGTSERVIKETKVIDSDVHLTVPKERLLPYLDEPWSSSIKNSYFTIFPQSCWDQQMGDKIGDHYAEFTTPEKVNDYRDEFQIEYPLLNIFRNFGSWSQPDLSMALMRAYNDILINEFLDEDEEFVGLGGISTAKPTEAAEEIDRLGSNDQIKGIYIPGSSTSPLHGSSRYDPIFQAAEDNDFPIVFHGTSDGFQYDFPNYNRGFDTFFEVHSVSHPWQMMATLTSLIGQGVPERFPDLDFVLEEAGLGWVPFMMHRMNKIYKSRRSEVPWLEKLPEEYIRESFYFNTQPLGEPLDPKDMRHVLELIGIERLVFATDYPHWDFDAPEELNKHLRNNFTKEERQQVLHDTPAEVYNINT